MRSKPKAGGRRGTPRNLGDSVAPDAIPVGPSPRLKIHLPRAQQGAAPLTGWHVGQGEVSQAKEETGDEDHLGVSEPETHTRRSGRAVKPLRYSDFVYGSDDFNVDPKLPGEADYESVEAGFSRKLQHHDHRLGERIDSLTPLALLLQKQQPKTKPGRPSKRKLAQSALSTVLEDSWPEVQQSSVNPDRSPLPIDVATEERVDEIVGLLGPGPKMVVELPQMKPDDGSEMPYSATLLMRLYIRAHKEERWHICDLVADTWIRAFHEKRRRQEHVNEFDKMCWRFNEPLYTRRTKGSKGFDPNAPNWSSVLDEYDPPLDPDVTDFKPELLDQLYTQAEGPCAARNLWADAMALCGSKLEKCMQIDKRRGVKWNEKLVYDIMCTTLRMTRRKLTLKVEEATEGAWCKRYHMHALHNKPCYRKLAYDRKLMGEDASDEDEQQGEPMTLVLETDIGTPLKRGAEEEACEAIDEDAEGESDDD